MKKVSDPQNYNTVLIAEMIGFEDLSVQLSSEEFSSLINECLDFVIKKIELYGGTISNLDGENIKAVFGIPEPLAETPLKAVESAVELMERFDLFNQVKELPNPVLLRAGLESGQIFVNKIETGGHDQYNVFGETVNIASRIKDFAENSQVLVGPDLYSRIQDKFEFFALEPVPVKGQKKPLSIFELKSKKKKEIKSDLSSDRMITSEMVGRQAEFELLQDGIYNLIKGKGSVINIIGKAGIGKSRLMAEIRKKELLKDIAMFEGRALSNGTNLSFHPIIQIIKSWAGITGENSPEEAKSKLESNIRRIYPEAFDEIFPFISTMMGYRLEGEAKERVKDIEGEALENLILKNLRDLLSKAASNRPVVIVIEDAHWCDISSVLFLESLFKLSYKNRILFVNIFRPGYKDTSERMDKFLHENLQERYVEINIDSLTQEESVELIQNLLQQTNLPEEIKNLIIERGAGNPFFIEEVIRSFIDEGLIIIENNNFILTDNIKYANIPESIDNVILSRIDRLDGKTKDLLKTASVIGRNFYYKILEEATQTIEEMDNKLEYLKDVQLINERKQKDEVEFLFKHALAQQATYDSIVENSRKDLHLKIAGSIEKVFAGRIHEFYGVLAHHYSKAGKQEKTEEYLIKAGEESMRSGAFSEAVTFFKQTLDLSNNKSNLKDRQEIADLEEKLAYALAVLGKCFESIEYCERLIAYYYKPLPKSGFRRLLDLFVNVILLYRITFFKKSGTVDKANEVNSKLLKILVLESHSTAFVDPKKLFFDTPYAARFFKRKRFGSDEAMMMMTGGTAFLHTGILFNLGKRLVEWGKNYIDEIIPLGWIRGKFCIAILDYNLGKKIDISEEEKVVKYAIQIGEFFHSTNYYNFSCLNIIESGDEKLTQHFMNRILQISEAFDSDASLAQYHRINITYNIKFRKLNEVINITNAVVDFLREKNLIYVLIALYSYRSMAFILQSNLSEARKNLVEAEKVVKSIKIITLLNVYQIARCHLEIAEFQQNSGTVKDAGNILRSTKKLIKLGRNVRKNLTEAYRLRALIFWLINKPNKALRNFEKSINAGLSYDCNLELSRTYFEAGKFLSDPNNKKERINGMNGTECLMKAQSMFKEMNLEWDLKEYENQMNGNGG